MRQDIETFKENEMCECYLIYTKFKSAISQMLKLKNYFQLKKNKKKQIIKFNRLYFVPTRKLFEDLILNIAIQIHSALLENLASEQGSRMTAMDNATRNANDMMYNLTLFYNRSRQALITKELIEIISGAEAV